jgi:hypothetical protein
VDVTQKRNGREEEAGSDGEQGTGKAHSLRRARSQVSPIRRTAGT